MNLLEIAYAAGVIDSDGWITISPSLSSYRVFIGLAQVEPQAVRLMSELFSGAINLRKKSDPKRFSSKPMYTWRIEGKTAKKALFELLPYLRIKKAQARLALGYLQTAEEHFKKFGTQGSIGLDAKELVRRTTYYLAMKELNHRAAAETKREGSDLSNQISDSPNCKNGKLAETAEMPVRLVKS